MDGERKDGKILTQNRRLGFKREGKNDWHSEQSIETNVFSENVSPFVREIASRNRESALQIISSELNRIELILFLFINTLDAMIVKAEPGMTCESPETYFQQGPQMYRVWTYCSGTE